MPNLSSWLQAVRTKLKSPCPHDCGIDYESCGRCTENIEADLTYACQVIEVALKVVDEATGLKQALNIYFDHSADGSTRKFVEEQRVAVVDAIATWHRVVGEKDG